MNMARLSKLMAKSPDDKPDYMTEILKAVIVAAAVWMATTSLQNRGTNEHRFTKVETEVAGLKDDVREIKSDVKEILRRVKR